MDRIIGKIFCITDDSVKSQPSSSLPKLSKVDTKSRIPVSTKNKSQEPGAKIKPILSPSSDINASDQVSSNGWMRREYWMDR